MHCNFLPDNVAGGSTSSDISLTSTESSSSSPSSGHYGQLAREMSKPLIITADQSMTSTSTDVTLNTTSNTSDSNEHPDLEKRRRVKPETIVEGQAMSSASEGELPEAERVRMQLQRVHQDINDRYEYLPCVASLSGTQKSALTTAACAINGIIGATKPASLTTSKALAPIATGMDLFVSITRTLSPHLVTCAVTDRITVAPTFRTRRSK